ncbi:fatty acyl-AMP ligase [Actinocrispum sp. NPDC049592]|uniref:fatty acyl-AMP ligase n=1 Tax=Actinocrispum sp. NPDC049592 TaxID=3154835 RepID=UPI00341BCF10
MSWNAAPQVARILHDRATADPQRTAYEFVSGDGGLTAISYDELFTRAMALAAGLRAVSRPAKRPAVLLQYPAGIEYVVALYACMYAGLPAIPAHPPEAWRRKGALSRLSAVMADARPSVVLAPRDLAGSFEHDSVAGEIDARVVTIEDCVAAGTQRHDGGDADPAVLVQYTSGTTRAPRGVVISRANLDSNVAAIAARFGLTPESRTVIWLPPFHDMGLIGGILTPMYAGIAVRLMSSLDFLKRPVDWLRQIADFGATVSGAPDFAYDLCVRRVTDEQVAELDLSRWELAFNGAERVRASTLREFSSRFAPAGFRAEAFYPCYGLAEATLYVSGGHWDPASEKDTAPVPCGPPLDDMTVRIVDPAAQSAVPAGATGEIWLRGPSVVDGHWDRTEPDTFGRLDGVRYLRTGDLGRLDRGGLVVLGRLRDRFTKRGVNYHPEDIEQAAEAALASLRSSAAAFAVDTDDGVRAVVLLEVRVPPDGRADLAQRVRSGVLAQTGLSPDVVVAGPPGLISRTASGKVQRHKCGQRFLAGEYDRFTVDGAGPATVPPDDAGVAAVARVVAGLMAAVCEVDSCATDQSFLEIGGDSLRAAEGAAALQAAVGFPVPADTFLMEVTPDGVAGRLVADASARGLSGHDVRTRLGAPAVPAGVSSE